MARTIQQVKQELEVLEQTVAETATQLQTTYDDYLDILSESAQKQLILASYQICTKIYAESFLKLSFSQRQKLQEKLRALGKEIKPELKKKYRPKKSTQEADLSLIAEMLKNLPLHKMGVQENSEGQSDDSATDLSEIDKDLAEIIAKNTEGIVLENGRAIVIDGNQVISIERKNAEEENSNLEKDNSEDKDEPEEEKIDLKDPKELMAWQKNIEKQIKKNLDNISKKANIIFQERDIVPQRLPTRIMEVALQNADGVSRINKVKSIPNILSLVIEVDKGKKSKTNTNFGNISLLRLKLVELEFGDPVLSSKRSEIRNLLKKISRIQNIYQDKKKEYAIAEADAAWRSSWYED
ncbi:MAG: hypothetical protein AAGA80_11025 [Cyanobacteria bacterium P01_F01_bin.143]